jgi:hypothetical protein
MSMDIETISFFKRINNVDSFQHDESLFCVVILSLVIHDFVWGKRTLLPNYYFQITVCLHRFFGNQQSIIIITV